MALTIQERLKDLRVERGLTLEQLERAYRCLESRRILGVDICGEANQDDSFSGWMSVSDKQNDAANRRILRMLRNGHKKPEGSIQ